MIDFSHEQLREAFSRASRAARSLILEEDGVTGVVHEIARKRGLHVDQEERLHMLTTYTLVGLISMEQFVQSLAAEVGVPADQATDIIEEINKGIFHPLHDKIRKGEENVEEAPALEEAAPLAPLESATIGVLPDDWEKKIREGAPKAEGDMLASQLGVTPTTSPQPQPPTPSVDPYREPIDEKKPGEPK